MVLIGISRSVHDDRSILEVGVDDGEARSVESRGERVNVLVDGSGGEVDECLYVVRHESIVHRLQPAVNRETYQSKSKKASPFRAVMNWTKSRLTAFRRASAKQLLWYYRRMTTRTVKYAYRAEPTPRQRRWLTGAFGAVRVVYNCYVWDRQQAYETGSGAKPRKLYLAKGLPQDMGWLAQYSTIFRQQAVRQAETAYKNFFAGLSGQRANRVGKPRFKKRRSGGSLTWNGGSLQVKTLSRKWGAVRLPKEGSWLRFRLSRKLPSAPTGVTLKLSPAGEYTVSFTVREEIAEPKASGSAAGVDMGLIDLASVVQDDGSRYKIPAPKSYRRAERKLARLQREHSRKVRGSQNREKARLALAKQHGRVARQRLDQARQIAAKLTSENQVVSLEALNLKGQIGRAHV